jgi:hypothetical protein
MGLYRFEVLINNEVVHVVIVAENEEQAFRLVDVELEKYFLKMPEIEEITLYEVKKIRKSGGFVIQGQETIVNKV